MKLPRYKLVSENGLFFGSKLIDLEDGKEIKNVSAITLHADCNDLWRAQVTLIGVAIDVCVGSVDDGSDFGFPALPRPLRVVVPNPGENRYRAAVRHYGSNSPEALRENPNEPA